MTVVEILRKSALLADLPEAALVDMGRFCSLQRWPSGHVFFEQGNCSTGMYWVGEGEVELLTEVLGDETRLVRRLGEGAVLGELALLDGGQRSATAVAATPGLGLTMHEAAFQALVAAQSPTAMLLLDRLTQLISQRVRDQVARIAAQPGEVLCRGPTIRSRPELAPLSEPPAPLEEMYAWLPLPQELAPADLARLGRVEGWPRGAVLALQDEAAHCLWVVLSGALRVTVDRHGRAEQLLVAGPGSFVGALAMVNHQTRPCTIDVREEAWLVRIEGQRFESLQGAPCRLAFQLTRACAVALAHDLRRLNRHETRLAANRRFEDLEPRPCAG
jgi:CRP-like cAMP-binding protein